MVAAVAFVAALASLALAASTLGAAGPSARLDETAASAIPWFA